MLVGKNQCPCENDKGVRCSNGENHAGKCIFAPVKLTYPQEKLLLELLDLGPHEYFGGGDAPARSLELRGLIGRKFIGQRYWLLFLTPYGTMIAKMIEQ